MPLESLLELVQKLQKRIDTHGEALRQSEWQTRDALIDPLLRELGWDTSNPGLVVPEYRSHRPGGGSADYALLHNDGRPAMMVEAKRLGTALQNAVPQGIQYCMADGTKHFAVTDGQSWEVYETHKPVPIDEKRIVSFDLKRQPPAKVCLKALALWRPTVEAGHVAAAESPVILSDHETDSQAGTTPDPKSMQPAPHSSEWRSLSDWNPKQGDDLPVEIMFPDGSKTAIRYAYNVAVESTAWLVKRNHLTRDHCPIKKDNRGKRNLVTDNLNLLQYRGTNNYKQVGELYIDVKYNGFVHARNARTIIAHVGQDSAQFKIRFP